MHVMLCTFKAPDPVDVRVTSSPSSPIRSIGSNIILMCSVELSLGVDAPVNLNIDLSGPGNWSTNESLLIHETSATINATITPFGSSQSGNYSCTVTVHSTSPFHTGFGSLARFAEIG